LRPTASAPLGTRCSGSPAGKPIDGRGSRPWAAFGRVWPVAPRPTRDRTGHGPTPGERERPLWQLRSLDLLGVDRMQLGGHAAPHRIQRLSSYRFLPWPCRKPRRCLRVSARGRVGVRTITASTTNPSGNRAKRTIDVPEPSKAGTGRSTFKALPALEPRPSSICGSLRSAR
jgi:hypothetical protein